MRNTILDIWLKLMLGILVTAFVGGVVAGFVALGLKWANEASNPYSLPQNVQQFQPNPVQMPTTGWVVWFPNGTYIAFTGKNAEKNGEAVLQNNNNSADGVMMTAIGYDNGVANGTIPLPPPS